MKARDERKPRGGRGPGLCRRLGWKYTLSCRAATGLISASFERRLPFWKSLLLRWHLRACRACARFRQQLRFLRDLLRGYDPAADAAPTLPPPARERIKRALRRWLDGRA